VSGSWVVTGGSGFIGGALLQALRAAAPQQPLWLAGRREPATACAAWRPLALDLAGPTITLPAGVHTVLHLAGEKRDAARMPAVNAEGARRLVEAAARAGARRFVHLSSVGVYGAARHAGVVTEAYPHTPHGPYETSKDTGERDVRERCAALDMPCVVLQPSNVVGIVPGHSLPLLGLARMVARGWFRHFGQREAWVNYVAVEDVAAALLVAAPHDSAEGVFIVNTPAPLARFVGWMADELGQPPPRACLPWWVGAAAAGAGAAAGAVLRRSMPFDPARFGELTNTTRYDGTALQRAFGFGYPLGIEAALRAMVRQYRAQGLV
jgi:nucleoside-diphosphate-sugar epimerase